MIGGILSALLFGVTSVVARRAIRLVGFVRANAWRLALSAVVLGLASLAFGGGTGAATVTLLGAGAIGLGIGGVALFRALPLLGAPLASLVVETLAAVVAAGAAWAWFDDRLTLEVLVACVVILVGVVAGLVPYVRREGAPPRLGLGLTTAALAAAAQGLGLVLTRKALLEMPAADAPATAALALGGGGLGARPTLENVVSASFVRLLGGAAVALVAWGVVVLFARRSAGARAALAEAGGFEPGEVPTSADLGAVGSRLPDTPAFWVGANAVVGPILGVTALVWALTTLQPGVAQAITAVAALISVPVAHWLEGHEQPPWMFVGAAIAAAGLWGLFLGIT